ncbi:MAG: D-alanyl-D-alanine carboxypeptidase family protein [Pseudomonadota bacterium]|nr:D-alanyl-D-alanine carboxypeptidase family protein [Pseudomonadota bacterium]
MAVKLQPFALPGRILSVLLILSGAGMVPALAETQIPTTAKYVMVTEFETGRVLMAKEKDAPMKPASMAKIMTSYVVFSRIKDGSLALEDQILVSEKAWKMGGSRSFLKPGTRYSVKELLYGKIVQSGNDAAVVLAEGLAGTEENFVQEMNLTAQKLGMKNTNFTNATGWPHPDLTTTAEDLNILATALIRDFPTDKYPELYPIYSVKSYTLNDIKQGNRNPLLYGKSAAENGVDGLKTGYTEESGYGLIGSAVKNNMRVVMVLNGMASKKERSTESARLMDYIQREFKNYRFFASGDKVDEADIWLGQSAKIGLRAENEVSRVLSRSERMKTEISVSWVNPVPAPVTQGQKLGEVSITIDGKIVDKIGLMADRDVDQLGMFDRLGAALSYLVLGASNSPASAPQ